MKKLLSVLLALSLLCSFAVAETLTIDLDTATIDELTAAQSAINDRISALRAAEAPAGEAITLSGTGTTIQSGVEVTQVPARVSVTGPVEVTFTGGKYDYKFNNYEDDFSCEELTEAATYDLLIEGDADWSITIEPLREGGTMELSGTGPYVSDFFPLTGATIVHVTMDASMLGSWSASLYLELGHQYSNISSWRSDSVLGDSLFSDPLKLEGDAIIKPTDGRDQYYWIIDVPVDAQWSITAK
ncbi:MAG: hypothetical protein PHY64_00835 [Eubacteriales bacterium]|nr:hypothetical protein [Eubacteriales bacterium]